MLLVDNIEVYKICKFYKILYKMGCMFICMYVFYL